jgi:hypothetical protein
MMLHLCCVQITYSSFCYWNKENYESVMRNDIWVGVRTVSNFDSTDGATEYWMMNRKKPMVRFNFSSPYL